MQVEALAEPAEVRAVRGYGWAVAQSPGHANLVSAGQEALGSGAWEEARRSFEAALESVQVPEALEGLSWAAWWMDDADTVFDARGRAYKAYRRGGDSAGAARMATWIAVDQLDFNGAVAVASGWLERARRLLEPLEPGPDHGWLAFHEGYIAHADGDTAKARRLASEAAELGREFGVADLEMLGLALEGGALVACAEVEQGMRCLDEATATALEGEATIPISTAWTCCFLVTACTAVLDFKRAHEWCDRIAEFDVVTSSMGAIFAPDHQAVADELVRVCRPGGTIGMITFIPEGTAARFFELFGRYAPPPPPGALPPTAWGSEEHVRALFGDRVAALEMSRNKYVETAPSPRAYVDHFKATFGPAVAIYAGLADQPDRLAAMDREFQEFAETSNRGAPGGPAEFPYRYLLVVARTRDESGA
ncbi:MAG: regulatory protein, LuxR [Solirubrobacterales bacterium]|jgi:hypothetical protein|nr:regulatory protein, LuxR [Solirubrobacterales bacterium]